jgi:hypothetical protein
MGEGGMQKAGGERMRCPHCGTRKRRKVVPPRVVRYCPCSFGFLHDLWGSPFVFSAFASLDVLRERAQGLSRRSGFVLEEVPYKVALAGLSARREVQG